MFWGVQILVSGLLVAVGLASCGSSCRGFRFTGPADSVTGSWGVTASGASCCARFSAFRLLHLKV